MRPRSAPGAATPDRLDDLLAIERRAYSHPWTLAKTTDALASGYQIQLLLGPSNCWATLSPCPAWTSTLLNLTVSPDFQQQGWARVLLDALALWARGRARSGCGWKCA